MADTAKGIVSMTPVVTIAADDDSDSVDVIHHDIRTNLEGVLEYEKADSSDKWVYNATRDVTGTSADLLSGPFTEGGTVATDDNIQYLFLKHTGTSDGTTTTTDRVYINIDGGNAASVTDVVEIGANEAINLKFKTGGGPAVADVNVATSSSTVRCVVVAIVNDR